jgi:hypothetical protein
VFTIAAGVCLGIVAIPFVIVLAVILLPIAFLAALLIGPPILAIVLLDPQKGTMVATAYCCFMAFMMGCWLWDVCTPHRLRLWATAPVRLRAALQIARAGAGLSGIFLLGGFALLTAVGAVTISVIQMVR